MPISVVDEAIAGGCTLLTPEDTREQSLNQLRDAGVPAVADDAARRYRVDELNAQARASKRVDYDVLKAAAEEAFELACQTDEDGGQYEYGMAEALSLLAHRNCMLGEWQVTLSQASQALALLAPFASGPITAELYDSVGWTHFYMGDYVEALHHLMRSLEVAEAIGDRSMQAHALDRIANVNASSGHPDVALEAQERALAIHRDLGDELGEAIVLNNVAYTLRDVGDLDSALSCAQKSLEYCERTDRPYLHVGVLDTMAEMNLALGRIDAAEEYAAKALEMAREQANEPDETNCLMALGRIAVARGDLARATELLEGAAALALRRGQSVEQFECHRLLSDAYERRGDNRESLRHFKRFHELKEAKINGETESRLANLRVQHQVESARKDAEILRLRGLALEREVERRKIAQAELEAQASLDPLTGLFNRRHLEVLSEELNIALASGRPVSLMMFDIDGFKRINDSYGHGAGDRVLVTIAGELTRNARRADVPCRYGGDEFLVLLIDMDAHAAGAAAERLREVVSASPVSYDGSEIPVTISAGVASADLDRNTPLNELIERADKALYAAKQGGRDRVVVYGRDV